MRQLTALVAVGATIFLTPLASARVLVASALPDVTAEATSSSGAIVTYSVDPSLSCSPASGSQFPLGPTTVTCSGTDSSGNSIQDSFTVNVVDTTPPAFDPASPPEVDATTNNPSSDSVSYTAPTATDLVAGSVPVNCSPASGSTFNVGTTPVTCTASDGTNTASVGFNVVLTFKDTQAPSISISGPSGPIEATGPGGASASFTVNAADNSGVAPAVNCNHTSPDTFPIGDNNVHCTATDAAGNSASADATITVQDTTPPVLTLPDNMTVAAGDSAVYSPAPTAVDAVDGNVDVTCNPASGSVFSSVGPTTVNCSAKDAHGNTASGSFTVTAVDKTPPTVVVPGDKTVEATGPSGAVVSFSVSATDNVDPSPDVSCSPHSGSTFPLGSTTVSCTATDDSGNQASNTFSVNVVDTQAPTVTVPGDQTVEATGPSGAAVSFSASATDTVDPSPGVSCSPSSGSTLPLGTTKVTCTAKDKSNNSSSQSFNVNVVDTTAPTFNTTAAIKREANSPQGSVVNFAAPTAVDLVDGPIAQVACTPASGSVFPLGTTSVNCRASDAHGNVGKTSFTVRIVDTTPPILIVPGDRTYVAPTSAGEASSFFTRLAAATDIADPHPTVSSNAPDLAPVGTTVVTFTARDASGNTTSGTSKMTVLPPGSVAPQTAGLDRTPPDDVGSLTARGGDGVVVITWKPPKQNDFGTVVITRQPADGSAPPQVVYRGSATTFRDRGVKNGVEYRYVVTAVDRSGNASAGAAVIALPKAALLRAPRDGARVSLKKTPTTFKWVASANATYYNFQLFHGSTKILSAWPVKNAYTLQRTWKYDGRRYRLAPGAYIWYVWPGLGARADVKYGPMLGSASFTVTK